MIESINKLSTRIDAAEQRTSAQIKPIMDKVDQLASQIERVDQVASQIARVEDLAVQIEEIKNKASNPVTTAPVERAVMRMSERLQKLEQRNPGGGGSSRGDSAAKSAGLFARLFKRGGKRGQRCPQYPVCLRWCRDVRQLARSRQCRIEILFLLYKLSATYENVNAGQRS
ncbi:MAG: hypothetical protein EXQ92_08730 [Alphaproteobacteria bacterium]|nr:hypothetical protein [Alphaproteobacteria bacterium]